MRAHVVRARVIVAGIEQTRPNDTDRSENDSAISLVI
jgi:hypothetical protein